MPLKKWAKAPYIITLPTGEQRTVYIGGRERWAIEELRKAGPKGRTGREALGPRWAAYIWKAKHLHGIPIADAWEPHEGEHPGRHKRWFLDCDIRPATPAQEVQA
ncbi:hypothetical protein Q4543_22635 [Salipiger sp. 1_MG-2023]|uniref:winged helix domain-containing protein n=1 Tax=Salipiger sp. 1_MG-2023 TaxID=3062665 RepID=UPI0026E49414|nr:hypothetical protein [Salipiger sp. 1_MG-2023]MDO6588294.1 hypothetical protein [Salipiger sp. 1_MG-2023]